MDPKNGVLPPRYYITFEKVFCVLCFVLLPDVFFIDGNETVTITPGDIIKIQNKNWYCIAGELWTFSTSVGSNINIEFEQFGLHNHHHEYVELGDGLEKTEGTTLAHFTGRSLPQNVTSVSNSAWVFLAFIRGNITLTFTISVKAVNSSGNVL